MLSEDLFYIFNWWIWLFLIGIVSLPITYKFFGKFIGVGYGLSKTIGLMVFGYLVFFLSTIQLLPLYRNILLVFFLIYACFNYWLLTKDNSLIKNLKENIKTIAFIEFLFIFGLVSWSIIRGYQPDINGLEKLMDYGFINSILRSEYLPPVDMWFAGENINYYWFGHFITALITKLSNIPSSVTYNLMIATILGLSLSSTFTISASLVQFLKNKFNLKTIFAAGIISAVLLNFGGNFHTPIYALKDGADTYWYPDATRFIGYSPDREDKTIHEFPHYSFVVSDLHAHLLNFPFVLVYIALLVNFVQKDKKKLISKRLLPLAFTAGVLFITSTWDYGNYLLTTGVTLLVFELQKKGLKVMSFVRSGLRSIFVAITAIIFALPFILNFNSITQGVKFVNSNSYLWQLAVLWGFPFILTFALISILKKFKTPKSIKPPDLLILCLHVASWILILLPEIFYVKDIYIASHHRANTMFKLTYQAFVMFYLSSGYIAVRAISSAKLKVKKIAVALSLTIIFGAILSYPSFAVKSYYNRLINYQGLDGTKWLSQKHPGIYNTIDWFSKKIDNQPVILEAPGDSYTEYDIVSSYTGLPTVSGWFVHEWLWRGTADIPQARVSDITQIYNTPEPEIARSLLQKYEVEYVIVGDYEHEKFPQLNENKFNEIGKKAFASESTIVYEID